MEKKLYIEPAFRIVPLALQETMLTSIGGTGDGLITTGDYDDKDFDDLFN